MSQYSVVEYFGQDDGHSCGYCKGKSTSFTHGMWGHVLSNRDYQDLIDRGWRRSGKYVYKPVMDRTCCPQYTIRCDVGQFQPTRSHKKVLKKFRNFIINGRKEKVDYEVRDDKDGEKEEVTASAKGQEGEEESDSEMALDDKMLQAAESKTKMEMTQEVQKGAHSSDMSGNIKKAEKGTSNAADVSEIKEVPRLKEVKPGVGADPGKPRARKAKELRRERVLQKNSMKLEHEKKEVAESRVTGNREKTLSDFLDEPFPDDSAHRFEIRMVWAQRRDPKFAETFAESLKVYQKYQTQIHGDRLSKVTAEQFTRFLCDASLLKEDRQGGTCPEGRRMGGFHQQYLLDGHIFCVGVVDILPNCLSSVYLFYDPEFRFLSPGTLSSLFELHFTHRAALPYYYMGFYIHDCPKMRYKGQYAGSHLLCPERYVWVPVEQCRPILDKSKYARLRTNDGDDGASTEEDDMSDAMILHQRTAMPYAIYRQMRELARDCREDDGEIREYRRLVGASTAARMLLFRE